MHVSVVIHVCASCRAYVGLLCVCFTSTTASRSKGMIFYYKDEPRDAADLPGTGQSERCARGGADNAHTLTERGCVYSSCTRLCVVILGFVSPLCVLP